MECTPCVVPSGRQDKPHTFFAHEQSQCPRCEAPVEARIVLRDGAVFALALCSACGHTERPVHDDADAYVAEFVARGHSPDFDSDPDGDHVFKQTTSTCPTCLRLLTADVVIRGGRVYFRKDCPACGPSRALVSENAEYYASAYAYARAGTMPLNYATDVVHGCPTDCGTCSDHEQHTCLPIVEITDHCNLECPICIVNNQYSQHMQPEEFARIVDTLISNEGTCESIALSGGEPTSHPRLLELIDIADREEIGRVVVITNGLRLGRDRELARALAERGAYVALQIDGFDAETHESIRGRDLTAEKQAALAMLREFRISTQLIFVATRGVNEHQVGQAVELLLSEDHILSLNFQPAAYTGLGGGEYAHDPLDRLTIPGVIRLIAEQTDILSESDFSPLPCSHPQCVSLSYLLRLNDGSYVPFSRFIDFREYNTMLRSSATLPASPEIHEAMHDVIHDVFANEDDIDRGYEILAALRHTLDVMFPDRPLTPREAVRAGEGLAKSIFLHHYMDRHDFDLERLRKCCHHYAQPDGRIMPACGFNMFHRGAARGAPTSPQTPGPQTPGRADPTPPHARRLPVLR